MTWNQWLYNALKRTHGLFGEAIEFHFMNQSDKLAYLKVSYQDKDTFSSAISSYISTEELLGKPLVVTILQETPYLKQLVITDDDKLWYEKQLTEDSEMCN